jgi:hypothetical protein
MSERRLTNCAHVERSHIRRGLQRAYAPGDRDAGVARGVLHHQRAAGADAFVYLFEYLGVRRTPPFLVAGVQVDYRGAGLIALDGGRDYLARLLRQRPVGFLAVHSAGERRGDH